jgi:transcriptional regulator with XRE-family HTH domain
MNFAEKLKTLRKQKGISQEQLAEKIYVSRQAITKWESGNGIPDIENLLAISSLFNESLDSLLSEEKSIISKNEFL